MTNNEFVNDIIDIFVVLVCFVTCTVISAFVGDLLIALLLATAAITTLALMLVYIVDEEE